MESPAPTTERANAGFIWSSGKHRPMTMPNTIRAPPLDVVIRRRNRECADGAEQNEEQTRRVVPAKKACDAVILMVNAIAECNDRRNAHDHDDLGSFEIKTMSYARQNRKGVEKKHLHHRSEQRRRRLRCSVHQNGKSARSAAESRG